MNEENANRACGQHAHTRSMSESFLADAEKWERRAGLLTQEVGAKDIDDVLLWRIIEQCDREVWIRMKERSKGGKEHE